MIPQKLQQTWQKDLEGLDSKLGGTLEKPISSLLLMLDTPQEMVVVCTAGVCVCVCVTVYDYECVCVCALYVCVYYRSVWVFTLVFFFPGPGASVFTLGTAGEKGHEGGEEKLYCQVCVCVECIGLVET